MDQGFPFCGSFNFLVEVEELDSDRSSVVAGVPAPISKESLASLREWRRYSGIRRSIDYGSRWVLFEPNHPILLRRVEREARGFLHSLVKRGVLAPGRASEIEVRCEPLPAAEAGPGGRIRLVVQVPLVRGERRS